ncbi:membrane protein [Catellatospora sp. TT07R-123]|uniref:MFS transporter n=1 Tax=Catellatospora sp. TT07R-123 TaxID=2733863 RepID=UPI001B1431C6|nr:MFS transporter [Catellatospora sp. TT07R-123]GHJ46911.1 membrane protein [Catellatospora sp. TT07R-123]
MIDTTRATYRDVLREPVFRTLFLTRTLGTAASSLRILALSVLVFDRTGSPILTALTFAIGFVPQVVGGTLLGAAADRIPPRPLIATGFLLDAAAAAALALLAATLPVGASLGLLAVAAVFAPVFNGASARLVAEALTGDAYVLGRSLSSVASGGAQLLGLAFGGAVVAAAGPRWALLTAAGTAVAAAVWVRLGLPALAARPTGRGSAVHQSWHTTWQLLRDRPVRRLLLVQWLPPAFIAGAEALIVPYAADRGHGTGLAGVILACAPVGMVAGNVVYGRLVAPAARERLVAPVVVGLGAPLALLAAPVPAYAAMAVMLLAGAAFCYSLGVQRPFLDALSPDVRGQAFALQFTGLMTMQGVGPLVLGALAEQVSVGAAMAVAGAGTAAVGLWWWAAPARGAAVLPARAVS